MASRQRIILEEIINERMRQDDKWQTQNHVPIIWCAILQEESGEVAKAAIEIDFPQYRKELLQVAAVAVAAIESLDRNL